MSSTYTRSTNPSQETLPAYKGSSRETLPAYKGSSVFVEEKQAAQPSKTSRLSTLKSILSGDVHKHSPYLSLERSVMARSSGDKPVVVKPAKASSEKKAPSTLKSILTGDVHKHSPYLSLERSVMARSSVDRSSRR